MKMNKSRWILLSVLGVSAVCGAAATLYAADVSTSHGDHHDGKMHQLSDLPLGQFLRHRAEKLHDLQTQLALSDSQKTALRESLQSHHDEIASAIKPVAECKRALRDAVLADSTDETAIRAAADKLGKSIGDAAVTFAKIKEDVKTHVALTPDQQANLKKFRSEHDADIDSLLNHSH